MANLSENNLSSATCHTTTLSSLIHRQPQISLKQGIIIGNEEVLPNGLPFYSYKGIPYAKPPIGELRFMPPEPLEKFPESILDCRNERNVCIHKDILLRKYIGSEDCLFLNVYTPSGIRNKLINLPVMVFIHGGAFMHGSGNSDYYSPEYIVEENVIVITFNFRLGPLGFFSLPNAIYPNAGLKDQLMVLKWVKQNVHQFGGNPENVTLFGESAGGSSVHLHTLSDNSKKYFHKAIIQSGSALMEWTMQSNLYEKSKILAKLMGCKSMDNNEIATFLKNIKDPILILRHLFTTISEEELRREYPIVFKPSVEQEETKDAIITKRPSTLLKETNRIGIPIMMGYNTIDGLLLLQELHKKLDLFENDLGKVIPKSLNLSNLSIDNPDYRDLIAKIRKFYFANRKINVDVIDKFMDLISDYHLINSIHLTVELHARNQHKSPLYFYKFSFDGTYNFYKKMHLSSIPKVYQSKFRGASHRDESLYLFNAKVFDYKCGDERSIRTREKLIKLWTNFAKYGKPTPVEDNPLTFNWYPVKSIKDPNEKFQLDYLDIDDTIEMKKNPDNERIQFWRQVYEKFNNGFLNAKL